MENKDIKELQACIRDLHELNKAMASELTALRSLVRAMSLQPCFNRTALHLSASTLLDAAISETPPELQCKDTLGAAHQFLDSLLKQSSA
jgi:hypothetical protein